MNKAVHDLRTASRRFLAILEAVEGLSARKPVRRLARRVDRVLARLGRLRDLTVQREMLSRVTARSGRSVLRSFERAVERDFRRLARKARRRLRREDLIALSDDKQRILRRLRCGADDADARQKVLAAARAAAASLRAHRASVDPTRVNTLHEMRVALKNFRYLMEALGPVAPGGSKSTLETLHALQSTMGDLHDLEVLSSSLAKYGEKGSSERSAKLAPVLSELEAKHSRMLQSFLKSADAILEHWDEVLSAAPPASA
jgi:CHAD domain-containing protein